MNLIKLEEKGLKKMTLPEMKECELNILAAFHEFCKEKNLRYYMCGGTLLGAVRHKGFIPWDDDIDVFMPRPDFEKFKEMTSFNPISNKYLTCSIYPGLRTIEYPFMKVIDTDTVVFEKGKSLKKSIGIWIDIFPIDGFPEKESEVEALCRKNRYYRNLFGTATRSISETNGFRKKVAKFLIKPFVKLYGVKRICRKMDIHSQTYKYDECKYAGGVIWGYGKGERMLKENIQPLEMEFEGHKFIGLKNYDEYLTGLYKNYMELPPVEKRVCHEMLAFRKTEK